MSIPKEEAKPSIVFCSPSFWPVVGGIENWILQVASRLTERCRVFVITRRFDGPWPQSEVYRGIRVIRYHVTMPRPLPGRLLPFVQGMHIARLVRAISRESNGLVFNFFDPRPEHVCAALLLRVGTADSLVVCSLGGTMSEQAAPTMKQLAVYSSDIVIGISQYAMQAFGVKHVDVRVYYPTGQEPADFATRSASFESRQVLTVCRVHPRKNLETLIEVARRLPDISFIVAGNYSRDKVYYETLLAQATRMQVGNVHFLGEVDDTALQRLYSESTLFFLPSSHEMFGLVFGEALSYGLPVVAPRHTAVPEAVGADSGFLYEPDDLDGCAQGIKELVSSREHWTALSSRAKAFMRERYAQDYIGKYARDLLEMTGMRW